jgi:hypothetical protein
MMGEYSRDKLEGLVACLARHAAAGAREKAGRGAPVQPMAARPMTV